MDQIIPGLWIGDLACALAKDYLETAGITHIVTAMKQRLPSPINLSNGRKIESDQIYYVNIDDIESAPILVHFPGVIDFIDEALQQRWIEDEEGKEFSTELQDEQKASNSRMTPPKGKKAGQWATMGNGTVLVHCQAGISRSVAIVMAYLMQIRKINLQDALTLIRSRRSIADPNSGFMHQLELFESANCKVDIRNQRIRRFLMSQSSVLRGDSIDDVLLSYYPVDNSSGSIQDNTGIKLRCKKCRRELAAQDHVVEHEAGMGKDAFDVRKREKDIEQKSRDNRATMEQTQSSEITFEERFGASKPSSEDKEETVSPTPSPAPSTFKSAASLSAQLPPHLAALRRGTPAVALQTNGNSIPSRPPPSSSANQSQTSIRSNDFRKMLHSHLCSSYFVEPLAWMTSLRSGEIAGRLDCPTVRCGAKLGSWDWAGMQCACGAWVTPAFALHRSKVDEL